MVAILETIKEMEELGWWFVCEPGAHFYPDDKNTILYEIGFWHFERAKAHTKPYHFYRMERGLTEEAVNALAQEVKDAIRI